MKNQVQKKILVPIGDSEYAQDTVEYISKIKPFYKMKIVLFYVFRSRINSFQGFKNDPRYHKAFREAREREMNKKKLIIDFMFKAKQTLLNSGFSADAVVVKICDRNGEIIQSIVNEASCGYDTVIIGRKGHGNLKENIFGSAIKKIVKKLSFIPILIFDKNPINEKVLIAIDNSESSIRAVDFVTTTLVGFDFKIKLFHVIKDGIKVRGPHPLLSKESSEDVGINDTTIFDYATHRLTEAGFKLNQIDTQLVSGSPNISGAIIQEAKHGDFGTIVIGRRNLSKVQGFITKRVSNEIFQNIRNRSIWIVN